MKPSLMLKLLTVTIPSRLPILLKGAPGVGKTDIVSQACAMVGADLIVEHPVVSDPTDFKGLPFATKEGEAEFLPFGSLKKLITAEKLTVFFLDDLGQAPASVQAACMQLILARRINGHKVSDNVCFVAATNRHTDRAGVTGLLEPVKSRFVSIVELEPDLEDWVFWALKANLPTELIAFIRFRPGLLHDFKPTNEMKNTPSPRTVHHVGKLMQANIPHELEYECFSGAAGEGFAAEFCAFLKIYRTLPDPDVVLADPERAVVPDDPATLYAICGALAERASEQNCDKLIAYANRLPVEFAVLLVRDSVRKASGIIQTKPFLEWVSTHAEVLI